MRRRYTLVELLVVIAIIAILAGLIIPAVNSSLETGHSTSCQNNLKQIMMATIQYANANRDRLPKYQDTTADYPLTYQLNATGFLTDKNLWICPTSKDYAYGLGGGKNDSWGKTYTGTDAKGRTWSADDNFPSCYAVNNTYCTGWMGTAASAPAAGIKLTMIRSLSGTQGYACSSGNPGDTYVNDPYCLYGYAGAAAKTGTDRDKALTNDIYKVGSDSSGNGVEWTHRDQANFAYYDGHVTQQKEVTFRQLSVKD